jgi:tetratricopeptide (TPR) repeat protein
MGLLASLALLGCETPTNRQEVAAAELPELPVAVAGCDALSARRPACLRLPHPPDTPDKPLHLWLAGDWDPRFVMIQLDGQPLAGDSVEIVRDVDGTWMHLPSPTPGQLELRYPKYRPFRLEVGVLSQGYENALELVKARKPDEARRSSAALDQREAYLLDCMLARTSLSIEEMQANLAQLRTRAAAVDELRCISDLVLVLVDNAVQIPDLERASSYLAQVREDRALDLIARINAEYYAAILARDNGRLGEARHGFDRAIRLARRTGSSKQHGAALMELALLLARVGRFDEATPIAEQAVKIVSGRFALDIRLNKAWLDVLRRTHDSNVDDPAPELRNLVAAFAGNPQKAAVAQLNLAVAIMQTGDAVQAEHELARVKREHIEPRQQLYHELTSFRIALAAGNLDIARERLGHADLLAELIHDREFGLELLEARAELELQADDQTAALEAFARAEDLADALASQVPPNGGRSNFWTTLTRSRARHVELALEVDDPQRALCTVLGARSRHLRALATGLEPEVVVPSEDDAYANLLAEHRKQQRALERRRETAWRLSKRELEQMLIEEHLTGQELDELLVQAMQIRERDAPPWRCRDARPTARGTALLTAYPTHDGTGWVFLLDSEGQIASLRVEGEEHAEVLATRALDRFTTAGHLDAVTDVIVVPLGELLAVNFQMLAPFARPGGPRVRHGLGLGSSKMGFGSQADLGQDAREVAAVIGDGSPNLSEVDAELAEVRESLIARGWSLTNTWNPASDSQPRLLHYGGHAVHAGLAGWDSYLELPNERHLTNEQLLLERHAPELIVLGACNAGAVDASMLDGGMNIAVAFLLAGAKLVIAADHDVDDSSARALARALYSALPPHAEVDADAMIATFIELQRVDPRLRAWRAWVP